MKEEKIKKLYEEDGIVYIPKYKKIWYSIANFERYPEMATEGVKRAIGYLAFLGMITSLIVALVMTIQFSKILKERISYFDELIKNVSYNDGNLDVELNGNNIIEFENGLLIVDTGDISGENMKEYETLISKSPIGIIVLNKNAEIKIGRIIETIEYKKNFEEINIKNFDKEMILQDLINLSNSARMYITALNSGFIILFVNFFLSTLIDVLSLSVVGMMVLWIIRMRLRYRAVFNMSVYAITLSAILRTIYRIVMLFTDFRMQYFNIMYTSIALICLIAAIFMIKSDVVSQQLQVIISKEKENEDENKKVEEEEEEKEKEEEKGEEKKENDNQTSKDDDDKLGTATS